ncbi:MAG TPA: alpha/beta hydrolase, partial [Rhodospirillaceae bacterium]|nr:alpha/beta hydrolase [Rhodospirillaceae bacterium]
TDDFHADIPHVTQPVLLVRAGKGGVILDEDVAEMQSMKPDMLVSTVANAGHMIPWDDEPDFYRSMGDFLGATIA